MKQLILIAGPCVIEEEEMMINTARELKNIAEKYNLDFYFKSSFDKANRTSINSYRGPGIERGLSILKNIKKQLGVKICTDIHEPWQAEPVSKVSDILQIPAYLCRQTDLLLAAAKTGKIVNIKKGQFLSGSDMKHCVEKVKTVSNKIFVSERGNTFGYNRLVVDFTNLLVMKEFGFPVIFDATHSVQIPGGNSECSGGNSKFVKYLAKAAMCCGADGVFLEIHPNPERAKSDGPNMVALSDADEVIGQIVKIWRVNNEFSD